MWSGRGLGAVGAAGKALPNLHRNCFGGAVHVGCGEAEQAKAGADEAVLAAVVLDHSITMVAAVIFDCQALTRIEQVGAAQEAASIVMDGNLNLRPRKSGQHEQHPQPGLHWGLGVRLGQVDNSPQPRDALDSTMFCDVTAKLSRGHEPRVKEEVHGDDPFRQWISSAQVHRRAQG